MTTFRPLRDSSREGRSRLSCGSDEVHTRQWQASVGTPMDVPEPSTVIFSGTVGMLRKLNLLLKPGELADAVLTRAAS